MSKTIEPGTELDGGKYRILRLIGQGGMGAVFEAEHRDTQKRVAIKCLHPLHAADPEVVERLTREARATARVRHPNVVDVYDVGKDEGTVYLVMEYFEGESLSLALQRNDRPLSELLALIVAAMRGVAAAHKQGIIHRDIKPDNIYLAQVADSVQPVPKVLDFGISKLQGAVGEPTLTRSGTAVGTPCYMSYEQLAGEELDVRTDVYAFGVILYEAVTGRPPYEADTFPELMIRFSTQTPPQPKTLRPDIPTTLSRAIMWALQRERSERIANIDALIRELEPFTTRRGFEAEQTQRGATPSALTASGRGSVPRVAAAAAEPSKPVGMGLNSGPNAPRRPGTGVAALALILALALAALVLSLLRGPRSPEVSVSPALASQPPPVAAPLARPAGTENPRQPHPAAQAQRLSPPVPKGFTTFPAPPSAQEHNLPAAVAPRGAARKAAPATTPRPRDLGIY